MPEFSPDGGRVAFGSNRSGASEIWLADPDGSNAVQLTSMGAVPGFPRWSPDGEMVVFHSNPDGQADVYVIPAAGGRPRNLTTHPATDAFPSFLPGRTMDLLQLEPRLAADRIWKVPASGGGRRPGGDHVGYVRLRSP